MKREIFPATATQYGKGTVENEIKKKRRYKYEQKGANRTQLKKR